jgi:phenylpyruvate tautomerase PptA (4-oxalocrotonate tautomerase family)
MPIVEISALPQPASVDIPTVLGRVTLAVAAGMDCDPGVVWAVWRRIEPGCYVVRAHAPVTQPQESHDPIVRIMAYEGRSPEVIARTVEGVGRTLAGCLGLDAANIFVWYEELRAGRVFTGGAVRGHASNEPRTR